MPRPPSGQPGSPTLTPQAVLRATQLIYLSLIIGMLIFCGVATFMALRGTTPGAAPAAPGSKGDLLLNLLPFIAAGSIITAMGMPTLLRRPARNRWLARTDDDIAIAQAMQGYQAAAILRGALLEGPGLMGAVTVLFTANLWALLAPAVSMALLLALFPKTSDLQRWLDHITGGGR